MSGFLSNLAARSAGIAQVFQPHVPSLFEPPVFGSITTPIQLPRKPKEEMREHTARQSDPHSIAADNRSDEPPSPAGLPFQVPHLLPPQEKYKPKRGADPRFEEPEPAPPVQSHLSPVEEIPVKPMTPHLFPRLETVRVDPKSAPFSEPPPREPIAATPPGMLKKKTQKAMPLPDGAPHSGEAAKPLSNGATEAHKNLPLETARARNLITPHLESRHSPAHFGSESERFRLQPREQSNPTFARRRAPSAQPEPPPIQVTIGRIEVRATPKQPPANRERSASPVMSLNEYLRSREKRRQE